MKFCVVFVYYGKERTTVPMWSEEADQLVSLWESHNRELIQRGDEPYVTQIRKVQVTSIGCPLPN